MSRYTITAIVAMPRGNQWARASGPIATAVHAAALRKRITALTQEKRNGESLPRHYASAQPSRQDAQPPLKPGAGEKNQRKIAFGSLAE